VISVGLFGHSGDNEVWEGKDEDTITLTKLMLDDMHRRKIDMADEIFVINVGGYIGESTRAEIVYARELHKKVKYLEGVVEDKFVGIPNRDIPVSELTVKMTVYQYFYIGVSMKRFLKLE